MSTAARCDECGAELPGNAPQGLCPRCLIAMGLKLSGGHGSASVPDRVAPRTRLRYFGDYELLQEIARGGMGIVYKARQVSLNRTVAVKLLLFGEFSSDVFVQRFRSEAQAAASLRHPNIVAIHEVGEHEGQHYFSMDYIQGQSLADLGRDTPMRARQAAHYMLIVAQAIHYAHEQRVLHRDLKPSNILIDLDGQPHITDFGLAKRLERDLQLTLPGQVLGSPNYMPPEQADPKQGIIGPQSDVYSLGAILYHLLTGRPPFLAETLEETLLLLLNAEPIPPRVLNPAVPLDLETICLKCLNKSPQRRYSTAAAFADDLKRWQNGEPILARPISSVGKLWRWCKRKPAVATLVASVLLLLSAITVVSTVAAFHIDHARRDATNAGQQATRSHQETRERLWDSYLAQARATRFSGRVGRRFDSLDALAKAAAIRLAPELRNEAIACMALSDLRLIKRLPPAREIAAIKLAPDLTEYAVLQRSGEIRIYSSSDLRERYRIPAQDGTERRLLGFSHDGRLLAVGGDAHFLRVWDIHSAAVKLTCWSSTSGDSVTFSPIDERVAVINPQSEIVVYDLASGRSQTLDPQIKARSVAYDPTATRLAIGTADEARLLIVDSDSGHIRTVLNHQRRVRGLAWHPNGLILATFNNEDAGRLVHIWDTQSGNELRTLSGHLEDIEGVTFSRGGDFLFTSGWDATIVWNSRTGERLLTLPGAGKTFAPSTNDKLLARWNNNKSELEIYEFASAIEARKFDSREPAQGPKATAFSPDGALIAYAVAGTLAVYEVASGRQVGFESNGPIYSLHFDASTNLWASGDSGLTRRAVNGPRGTARPALGPAERVGNMNNCRISAMSPDRSLLAVNHDGHAHIFDVKTARELARTSALGDVRSLSFDSRGQWLSSGVWQGADTKIWSAQTGRAVTNLLRRSHFAAFNPTAPVLAAGDGIGVGLWDTRTWQPLWKKPFADLTVLAFAPNGTLLAVRDAKSFIHLLDAASGDLLAILETPGGDHVQDLIFTPDGNGLAEIQTSVRELILWDLKLIRKRLAEMKLDWADPVPSP